MTDMNILVAGIIVFGLMLVGMILTVVEFRRISLEETNRSDSETSRLKSESR